MSNSKGQSVAKFFGQTLKAAPESIKRSSVFDDTVPSRKVKRGQLKPPEVR